MAVECLVDGLKITATVISDAQPSAPAVSTAYKDRKLLVQLWRGSSVVASKSIRWMEEDEPKKIEYSKQDELLSLRGETQLVSLPIKLSRLISGASTNDVVSSQQAPLRFSSFGVPAKQKENAATTVVKLLREFLTNSDDRTWKKLPKRLAETATEEGSWPTLGGYLSSTEQRLLVSLFQARAASRQAPEIALFIIQSRLLSLETMDDFVTALLSNESLKPCVKAVIEAQGALPDATLARLLVRATEVENEAKVAKELRRLLEGQRGWNDVALREALTKSASPSQALRLLDACLILFSKAEDSVMTGKALSLASLVVDSQGTRLVWDQSIRARLLETTESIAGMTVLFDIYGSSKTMLTPKQREAIAKSVAHEQRQHIVTKKPLSFRSLPKTKPPASLVEAS